MKTKRKTTPPKPRSREREKGTEDILWDVLSQTNLDRMKESDKKHLVIFNVSYQTICCLEYQGQAIVTHTHKAIVNNKCPFCQKPFKEESEKECKN